MTQRRGIKALLGPTNTGKTTRALEMMLTYETGMIGFPLRLLARENYDLLCEKCGVHRVALVTGEERIIPPLARYYVATVEAMPLSESFSFMAVDEIQMVTDPQRGHVFTNRLLYHRGEECTVFMGSSAMEDLIQRLVPDVEIEHCERFSSLDYLGHHDLGSLPRGSAVVAFSARDVYENGDYLRKVRGGVAVVLGSMSPQARKLQVGLFERGEVDYLVSTDAIGMGLNLRIDHVAFSHLHKFDGQISRPLQAMEIGQIAGRAGRGDKDGTFGVTGRAPSIASSHVQTVKHNSYDSYKKAFWRNPRLSWNSPRALLKSLKVKPPHRCLITTVLGDDERALAVLAMKPRIQSEAKTPERVKLLWDVCRIPDYEKQFFRKRMGFLERIYRELCENGGYLPTHWVEQEMRILRFCEDHTTDMMHHLGRIRTWSYMTEQHRWISGHEEWHARLMTWEEELSERLHNRLMDRFVGEEGRSHAKNQDYREDLLDHMERDEERGDLVSRGHVVASMRGLVCQTDKASVSVPRERIHGWLRAREEELTRPLLSLLSEGEEHKDMAWNLEGKCHYRGGVWARCAGKGSCYPEMGVEVVSDWLSDGRRTVLTEALKLWQERWCRHHFSSLDVLEARSGLEDLSWLFAGMRSGWGVMVGEDMTPQHREVLKAWQERPFFRRYFRFNPYMVYMKDLMKSVHVKGRGMVKGAPEVLTDIHWTLVHDEEAGIRKGEWQALGFVPMGHYVLRADVWSGYRRVRGRKMMGNKDVKSLFRVKSRDILESFLYGEGWEKQKEGTWVYKGHKGKKPKVFRGKKKPFNPVIDKKWLHDQKKIRVKDQKKV
jgi:ATP-dependent RNA helicase SUPV3L1/SUV3